MWAPCQVTAGPNTITITTDYPFGDSAEVAVKASASMPLYLRIPSWAEGSTVTVTGGPAQPATAGNASDHTLSA